MQERRCDEQNRLQQKLDGIVSTYEQVNNKPEEEAKSLVKKAWPAPGWGFQPPLPLYVCVWGGW